MAKVEPITTARALRGPFDYLRPDGVGIGSVLVVPFGHRDVVGGRERLGAHVRGLVLGRLDAQRGGPLGLGDAVVRAALGGRAQLLGGALGGLDDLLHVARGRRGRIGCSTLCHHPRW